MCNDLLDDKPAMRSAVCPILVPFHLELLHIVVALLTVFVFLIVVAVITIGISVLDGLHNLVLLVLNVFVVWFLVLDRGSLALRLLGSAAAAALNAAVGHLLVADG